MRRRLTADRHARRGCLSVPVPWVRARARGFRYGWNTNDITAQPDGGWDESCGSLSATTFTHVG